MGNTFYLSWVLTVLLYLQITSSFSSERKSFSTSFCQAKQFKQMISHPGCQSKIIQNFFCYGQCESTFTPSINNNESEFTHEAVMKCSACRPTKPYFKDVSLKCDNGKSIIRTVAYFEFCQCIHRKCNKLSYQNVLQIPQDNNNLYANTQYISPPSDKINSSKTKLNNESRSVRRMKKCLAKIGDKQQACFKRMRDKEIKENASVLTPSLIEDENRNGLKKL
nr:neuroblastoma suppressor of tumorigenicity 1 [Hydra vulgaris]